MSETDPHAAMASTPPSGKRWLVGLPIAFVTGLVGAFLAAPVSDWAMRAHHVSSMEGGRACAVVAIWMPLGFFCGFAVGFAVTLLMSGRGFAGYAKRQGIALLITAALVGAVGGIGWATADHPPLIDGQALALDINVRVPRKGRSIEELQASQFDVALVVSASDRNYSEMRWSEAVADEQWVIVPAWAILRSRNAGREITAGLEGESRQIFNVMLPAAPRKIDETWSDWTAPRQRFDGSKPAPEDQYLARYRVRFAHEYSPTPSPTAVPDDVPEEPSSVDSPAPSE